MKKAVLAVLCVLVIVLAFPSAVYADMGPKPSVVIGFGNMSGESYFVTLLSSTESTGPYSAPSAGGFSRYQEDDENYGVYLKFLEYEDSDGFYFLSYFQDCTETNQFSWTYYPPREFRILLYFPETDRFAVSGVCERYAFDSYFSAAVSEDVVSASKAYHYSEELLSLIIRILLTLAVELGIALLFGFRQKWQFTFILAVNVATQIVLNVALNLINYYSGQLAFLMFYFLLELAVFAAEGIVYTICLRSRSTSRISALRAWGYSLAANAASFALGLALARWLPGIF